MGATVHGVDYPYGRADIDMIGEGTTWKLASYRDGNFFYLEPPQPKP